MGEVTITAMEYRELVFNITEEEKEFMKERRNK